MKRITPTTLQGTHVHLEPFHEALREGVQQAANDPRLWEVTVVRGHAEFFDSWWSDAMQGMEKRTRLPYAIIEQATGKVIGSSSYLAIALADDRLEIGSTWYVHHQWGSVVNPESKLLMMTHAFEVLGIKRVEFCVDAINTRSRAAVTKLGAVQEGILRSHRYTQTGRRRDTVVFSVIDSEWPEVKARLQARL
jgi:N-acetyltransferase